MIEKGSTKEQILNAALELFSIKGFEATSISQIAEAVGIRKASLYSHFASKQDILDTLIDEITIQFNQHSIFVGADWENPEYTKSMRNMTAEDAVNMVLAQARLVLHDPQVSKVRKMLMIEQFQNPELAKLQTKQSYEVIYNYTIGLMKFLISQEIFKNDDPEIMAAQFAFPVSMWINLCDREPQREAEVIELIRRHVIQFFDVYKNV